MRTFTVYQISLVNSLIKTSAGELIPIANIGHYQSFHGGNCNKSDLIEAILRRVGDEDLIPAREGMPYARRRAETIKALVDQGIAQPYWFPSYYETTVQS